jgi:periplasmic protein TonB
MSHESSQDSGDNLGGLNGCLVDGDPEQRLRERKGRRRALVLSIGLQSVVLAVIVLIPLLGKPGRIALANVTPLPPYYSRPAARSVADPQTAMHPRPNTCRFCALRSISPAIVLHDANPDAGNDAPVVDGIEIPGALPAPDSRVALAPPPPAAGPERPRAVRVGHIDPAMLAHRVEPLYPTLAKQIGRSGRVELRAVIAADGTVQSLEAVAGDPMFFASAMEAVRQWRYTPTVLNGQRVEVDTYITVIYNMQR